MVKKGGYIKMILEDGSNGTVDIIEEDDMKMMRDRYADGLHIDATQHR